MPGLVIGMLALAACCGWGWLICTAFGKHPSRNDERLLLFPFVGLGAAALLGSVLWMTGGFEPLVAWTLLAIGVAACSLFLPRDGFSAWRSFRSAVPASWTGRYLWGGSLLLALPILLAPDTTWDSGTFHLVIPREAALYGSLPLNVDHPFLFNMFTGHTLLGWGYLLGGVDSSVAGRFLQLALTGLGLAIAARRLARSYGPRVANVALALVLTTPIWIGQWGTAMVDIQVFATSAAGLALCTLRSSERRWSVVGAFALGLAAAIKHLGVIVSVSLAAVWVADGVRRRQLRPVLAAVALGCCCIAVASPWFVKNAVAYGSPAALDIGGEDAAVMAQHRLFEQGQSIQHSDFYGEPHNVDWSLPFAGLKRLALGYPWAVALSPLLLCWWLFSFWGERPRWWTAAWIGSLASFALFLLAVPSLESHSPPRYFFCVAPWAYFLAAVGWHRWVGDHRGRARLAWALFLVVSLPTVALMGLRASQKLPVLLGSQTELAYWQQRDPAAPLVAKINESFDADDRLFYVGERVNLLTIPRDQLVRAYQAHWAGVATPQHLNSALDTWGVTHVLVNDSAGERWDWGVKREWVVEDGAAAQRWHLVDQHEGARLYERNQ
ncbi:MAG: hypothetical protein AAF581_12945 [Planctomycetota bacterium]